MQQNSKIIIWWTRTSKILLLFFFYEKGMQSVSEDAFTVQYPDNAFNCLRDNTDNHFEGTDYWCAADMISDHRY